MTIRPFEGNELLKLADRMRAFFIGRDEAVWRAADVYSSVTQLIPGGSVITPITFDTVRRDTDGMWNAGLPTRLTVKASGWYVCSGHCRLGADAVLGTERLIAIRLNGTASIVVNNYSQFAAGSTSYMSCSRVIFFNSGDYIELTVLNAGAAGILTTVTNYSPILALCRYP